MICPDCSAGADLQQAALDMESDTASGLGERLTDVVGRPYAVAVVYRAVTQLHNQCAGCTCQHVLSSGSGK